MAIYKGYEVNDDLYAVIRYMNHVQAQRDNLEQQQISWDYLSVMAQLANLENELSSARKQFNHLTGVLLNHLGLESLKKVINEYGSKAQVSINILIRNLFERTADIGFLATDNDIRAFLIADKARAVTDDQVVAIKRRFKEYVAKYSVYHDVILLDKTGRVVVQLDDEHPVTRSTDTLIKKALRTDEGYVEYFGHSDLIPHQKNSLIYAYRVESEDSNEPLGVVCLCFKFKNELEGVFEDLIEEPNIETLVMLDRKHQVIASSREELVPTGTYVNLKTEAEYETVYCNGREYLVFARKAEAYQGYAGAGWVACVLLPLNKAFSEKKDRYQFGTKVISAAMTGQLFNDEIKQIPAYANQIQKELNRSVWNGNVLQASEKNGSDAAVSKVLLSEIKNTGLNTKGIFEESVKRIQQAVLSNVLKNSESNASLAIDIMDRNLYERANDCRWWALDNRIRAILDKPSIDEAEQKKIQTILSHINDLYTVYTNLMVFDQRGKVIAVSNPRYENLVGNPVGTHWSKSVMAHQDSQQYTVSEFEETELYDGVHTYIYAANIKSLDGERVIGGIGIVFDSTPQFKSMLVDVLPKDITGKIESHCLAVFTDEHRKIIATSDDVFPVGSKFEIDEDFYELKPGESTSRAIESYGHYYAIGCARSKGYREFKGPRDPYQQSVYAFVSIDIGKITAHQATNKQEAVVSSNVLSTNQYTTQLASFYVNGDWLGLKSEKVVSAVSVDTLVPVCGKVDSMVAGTIIYKDKSVTLIHSSMLMGANKPHTDEVTEAVIVKVEDKMIALTIDGLGEMMDVDPAMIQPVGDEISVTSKVITEVVLSNAEDKVEKMLQLIDVSLIADVLNKVVSDSDVTLPEAV